MKKVMFNTLNLFITVTCLYSMAFSQSPVIQPVADQVTDKGLTYTFSPVLESGENVFWVKEYGPDELTVDRATGKVTWNIPDNLPDEAFHVGVKAINSSGKYGETWVLTVGKGKVFYMGTGEAITTLAEGLKAIGSGDVLIIRDGTYSSNKYENTIPGSSASGQTPPNGNSGAFTTLIAENPGKAVFLGVKKLFQLNNGSYMALKGMILKNTTRDAVLQVSGTRIKLIDIGVGDASVGEPNGRANVLISGTYILLEGIYVWGNGRYRIQFTGASDKCVVRRCVARIDRHEGAFPIGGFQSYCATNIVYQNNIIIDSDHKEFWTKFTWMQNLYGVPATGCNAKPFGNIFDRCIAINADMGLMQTDAQDNVTPTIWQDNIGWDLRLSRDHAGTGGVNGILHGVGASLTNQSTIGRVSTPGGSFFTSRSEDSYITNSLLKQIGWDNGASANQGALIRTRTSHFYLQGNSISEFTGDKAEAQSINNSTIEGNTWNNIDIQYLLRSPLQNGGDEKRIGANVLTFKGKSGTFYGEPGYDTETNISMWPFPKEDVIKKHFSRYSYTGPTRDGGGIQTLYGNRGFADTNAVQLDGTSPVTLTSYIWEYLGNPIPNSIYEYNMSTSIKKKNKREVFPDIDNGGPRIITNNANYIDLYFPKEYKFNTLGVYNHSGQILFSLRGRSVKKGLFRVQWTGNGSKGFAKGIYFIKINSGTKKHTMKFIVMQ